MKKIIVATGNEGKMKEFRQILKQAGDLKASWYYPFPDYKFPMIVYSEKYLPKKGELNRTEYNFDRFRLQLFQESPVYDTLLDNDLYQEFANSFLLMIGKEQPEMETIYAKFSNERDRKFDIRTEIDHTGNSSRVVKKVSETKEAESHVNGLEKICGELGYEDKLLDVGEPFGLWVVESDRDISAELPFEKAGLPVVFTDNVKPYKDRKVRVLNGAHTASVLVSYLAGINIVRDMMHDKVFGRLVRQIVDNEIVPMVPLPLADVKSFADSVYERFDNPFIDHELLSISLNSVSKWKARVLPSFKDNYRATGKTPRLLTFSFAGLLAFYRSSDLREDGLHSKRNDGTEYVVHDNNEVLKAFAENADKPTAEYVAAIASNTDFWCEDLTQYGDFVRNVADYLERITVSPIAAAEYITKS